MGNALQRPLDLRRGISNPREREYGYSQTSKWPAVVVNRLVSGLAILIIQGTTLCMQHGQFVSDCGIVLLAYLTSKGNILNASICYATGIALVVGSGMWKRVQLLSSPLRINF